MASPLHGQVEEKAQLIASIVTTRTRGRTLHRPESRRFPLADERGPIVLITGDDGKKIAQNSYDEWGVPTGSHTGRFGYTGQTKIGGTELWHYKARAYSPRLGRFLQPDPIGLGGAVSLSNPSGMAQKNGTYTCTGSRIRRTATTKKPASFAVTGGSYVSPEPIAAMGGGAAFADGGRAYGIAGMRLGKPLQPPTVDQIKATQQQTNGSLLGKVWTLPYTLVGAVLGMANITIGALLGNEVGISFGNNAVQFLGGALGKGALTLGNSVIYGSESQPDSLGAY